MVLADRDLSREAYEIALRHRLALEDHLRRTPSSAIPSPRSPRGAGEPGVVRLMGEAAAAAGVGPMAAVAGAVAECVGEELRRLSATVIVENGGDLYLCSPRERVVGIYAGAARGSSAWGCGSNPRGAPVRHRHLLGGDRALLQRRTARRHRGRPLGGARGTPRQRLGNRLGDAGDLQRALEWLAGIPVSSGRWHGG